MDVSLRSQGIVFIISSPSGAGKSSLCNALLNNDNRLNLSISATTRPPRSEEQDGIDYFFHSQVQFKAMMNDNAFIEHAIIYNNHYGTPKAPVLKVLNAQQDVLFDVDTQGMLKIKDAKLTQTVSVFILPPSLTELEKRLHTRAQDSDQVIAKRLEMANHEINLAKLYDYVLINDDFNQTLESLRAIIEAERHRRTALDRLDHFIHSL